MTWTYVSSGVRCAQQVILVAIDEQRRGHAGTARDLPERIPVMVDVFRSSGRGPTGSSRPAGRSPTRRSFSLLRRSSPDPGSADPPRGDSGPAQRRPPPWCGTWRMVNRRRKRRAALAKQRRATAVSRIRMVITRNKATAGQPDPATITSVGASSAVARRCRAPRRSRPETPPTSEHRSAATGCADTPPALGVLGWSSYLSR